MILILTFTIQSQHDPFQYENLAVPWTAWLFSKDVLLLLVGFKLTFFSSSSVGFPAPKRRIQISMNTTKEPAISGIGLLCSEKKQRYLSI